MYSLKQLAMVVVVDSIYKNIRPKSDENDEKMEFLHKNKPSEVKENINEYGKVLWASKPSEYFGGDGALSNVIKARYEGATNSKVKYIPINNIAPQMISKVDSIPPVNCWVPINMNWRAKDEIVLHNRPYFDDGDLNDAWYGELDEHYGGKISGQRFEGYEMNDEILLQLAKSTNSVLSTSPEYVKVPQKYKDKFEIILSEAIEQIFPDQGSAHEIRIKLMELSAADTPTKPSSSYKMLFCRRCFRFNCATHSLNEENNPDPGPSRSTQLGPEVKAAKTCSPGCYLSLHLPDFVCSDVPNISNTNDGSYVQKSNIKQCQPEIDYGLSNDIRADYLNDPSNFWQKDGWSNEEKSFARMYGKLYPNNYCAVAKVMITKTCMDVYNLLHNDKLSKNVDKPLPFSTPKPMQDYSEWRSNYLKLTSKVKNEEKKNHHFLPCNHPGEKCGHENASCRCAQRNMTCEKFCLCSSDCLLRFPGCKCSKDCKTRCPCYSHSRECDPDLCMNCGAGEFDPTVRSCKNVSIQYNEGADTAMGISTIKVGRIMDGNDAKQMWGLFAKEDIEKDSLIMEYCGEIISKYEGERRGLVYDKRNSSYMFALNEEFEVDAGRKGNKIRFANHSVNSNCYAKVLFVNGDHRIGIFAKRLIKAEKEFLFDYGPNFVQRQELENYCP